MKFFTRVTEISTNTTLHFSLELFKVQNVTSAAIERNGNQK